LPLRYGIKFQGDKNWYEVYSAWEWLATQPTNKSPATTKLWTAIETVQDFSFPECISDYNVARLRQEIAACLRNEVRPRKHNLADANLNQEDFPNLVDRRLVTAAVRTAFIRVSAAILEGGFQYADFAQRNPELAKLCEGLAGGKFRGFLLGATVAAVWQVPQVRGFFQMVGEPANEPRLLPGLRNIQNAPAVLPPPPLPEVQAREGCWSCVTRVTFKFFNRINENALRNNQEVENIFRRELNP
jgi:hypothetical protein